ncbi:hypothetical protein, partial [Nocardia sp. NPDC059236]|uniref:hypothetical protein n=1 Tax=Nocardia sp. NPDC059236 TaxID=3346783 RepID=UPI0036C0D2E9
MAHLFGGDLLGLQQSGQGFVGMVPGAEGSGDFEAVPHTAFYGQVAGVDVLPEVSGYRYVAELSGGGDAVDGHVGRA